MLPGIPLEMPLEMPLGWLVLTIRLGSSGLSGEMPSVLTMYLRSSVQKWLLLAGVDIIEAVGLILFRGLGKGSPSQKALSVPVPDLPAAKSGEWAMLA